MIGAAIGGASMVTVSVSGRSRECGPTSIANSPASTTQRPSRSDQNEKARWSSSMRHLPGLPGGQDDLGESLQLPHRPGDRGLDVADVDLHDLGARHRRRCW